MQIKPHGLRSIFHIMLIGALLFGSISLTRGAALAAIPGDALYPVKTTLEQARLSLAQDAGERAQLEITLAEQRLEEIAALIKEGRYPEVDHAILAFEIAINKALLELETVSQVDPVRAARISRDITEALTRYTQTLGIMATRSPESVKSEVTRALETTQIVGGLELSATGFESDDRNAASIHDRDNSNSNATGSTVGNDVDETQSSDSGDNGNASSGVSGDDNGGNSADGSSNDNSGNDNNSGSGDHDGNDNQHGDGGS